MAGIHSVLSGGSDLFHIRAVGGEIEEYTLGGIVYRSHTFLSSNDLTVTYVPPFNNQIDVLIVAGGGGVGFAGDISTGGGGSHYNSNNKGGEGGSGIVIIRYRIS